MAQNCDKGPVLAKLPFKVPHQNILYRVRFSHLGVSPPDTPFIIKPVAKLHKRYKEDPSPPDLYNVPLWRWEFIDKKLKLFPLADRKESHVLKIMDMKDVFGEEYAYHWKNMSGTTGSMPYVPNTFFILDKKPIPLGSGTPIQGFVGYTTSFDNAENIKVCPESTISSTCKLFADKGFIDVCKSQLVNCEIYAEGGDLTILECKLTNCFIRGCGKLIKIVAKEPEYRKRWIGPWRKHEKLTIKSNILFFNPPELGYSLSKFENVVFSDGSTEWIGGPDVTDCKVSGYIRCQGNKPTFKLCQFSDYVQFLTDSLYTELTIYSGHPVITTNASIVYSVINGNCYIGDNVVIAYSLIGGNAIILENTKVEYCTITGGIMTWDTVLESSTVSDKALITGTTTNNNSTISGSAIVAGNETTTKGSIEGCVCNGVKCVHSVPEGESHWDDRSCEKTQKNKLVNERKDNTSPGKSDESQEAEPTIV